ncbi:hypothetical protein MNBD_GAMMA11-961 [hydrothermal vent metagenome]|uniref:SrpA-related protein n=1 Tax=hydrothermal vent metagenome TaxID=652676 RepID=A0A3B0Y0T8_9ZZZZ
MNININSAQNIQSSNPPGSISSRRANSFGDSSASNAAGAEEDKKAEEVQQQQDNAVTGQLRARDREVRSHEAAHAAAGGSLVRGGTSFTLQQGPDGRSYAIGGEVQLDVSPVENDPQATVIKSQRIQAAALAPAQPSAQDFKVAGNASQMAARARVEIAVERREETQPSEEVESTQEQADEGNAAGNSNLATGEISNEITTVAPPAQIPQNTPARRPTDTAGATLQSNDVPVAAISAFMATAKSESRPVQISQFA